VEHLAKLGHALALHANIRPGPTNKVAYYIIVKRFKVHSARLKSMFGQSKETSGVSVELSLL
jgi:hypothetical protein